jgi:hypothetical protein
MDNINYLEEPPPIQRVLESRKSGAFGARSNSYSAPRSGQDTAAPNRSSAGAVLVSIAALAVLSVQGWIYFSVRAELADMHARVEQAHDALAQVWESAKGLDEDRMGQLTQLADSLRTAFDYAQLQAQQLDADHANGGNARLEGLENAVERERMDALERRDRTHSMAFEALSRRAQIQEANMRELSSSVASLRATLSRMDGALAAVERQNPLGRRMESALGWVDDFRRAGLSADAVQSQFSALSIELRRIRVRVDSLRPMGRAVSSLEPH